jgi:hypothetical protein
MRSGILRKLTVLLIIVLPVFSVADCKKQEKCGCDGDVLFTLDRTQAHVYFNENGSNIFFTPLNEPYSTYYFCNPGEMFPKLADSKSGDILLVSGKAYWECNFLYQSSNYSYYSSPQKIYQVQVTNVVVDLYGKK